MEPACAEELVFSEGAIWWNDVWWSFPRLLIIDAEFNGTRHRFEFYVLENLTLINSSVTPYSRVAWLGADGNLSCCNVSVRIRVEGIADFKLSFVAFMSFRPVEGWNLTDLQLYMVTDLECHSFYIPHVANISFSPELPEGRYAIVNSSLCEAMADNYVLVRDPEGQAWVIAATRRLSKVIARVMADRVGFFWPAFWFSLDLTDEDVVLGLTIFKVGRTGYGMERLLNAASDLAHEALCICDCTVKRRVREYDYWLTELRYSFSPIPNEFSIDPSTTPPHNYRGELVNDTSCLAIYLPEAAVAFRNDSHSAFFLSSKAFAIGLYFNESAAGPRGMRDLWLGDGFVGGGFYVRKGYEPGDYIVVLLMEPAEKLIPSMFVTETVPAVSETYFRTAVWMCAISLALVVVLTGITILELRKTCRPQGSSAGPSGFQGEAARIWAFFATLMSSVAILFLWAYGYNIMKLHNLASALLAVGGIISSIPAPLRKSRRYHQLLCICPPLSALAILSWWWGRFMPEEMTVIDRYLLFLSFLSLLTLSHPKLTKFFATDKVAFAASFSSSLMATFLLFYFNLPKLIYNVEVDVIYSPFIATIIFMLLFIAYKLTK